MYKLCSFITIIADEKCPSDEEETFVDFGSPVRLTSIDYPEEYPPNVHCRWRLASPEGSVLVTKVRGIPA